MSEALAERGLTQSERAEQLRQLAVVVQDESRPLDQRAMNLCRIIELRRDELLAGIDPRVDRVKLIEQVKLLIREQAERVMGCTLASVIRSVKSALLSGLKIDRFKGEVDFIPRRRKVSRKGEPDAWVTELCADPNYRGLIHFVGNTGQMVKQPFCEVVYEGERLEFSGDADALRIRHTKDPLNPHRAASDTSKIVAAYCRWYLTSGEVDHILTWQQILEHRDKYSKGYQDALKYKNENSTWHKEPIKMGLKTVIRDAINRDKVPVSDVDRGYILSAERIERGEVVETEIVDAEFMTGEAATLADEAVERTVAADEQSSLQAGARAAQSLTTDELVKRHGVEISHQATQREVGEVHDKYLPPDDSNPHGFSVEQQRAMVAVFQARLREVRPK